MISITRISTSHVFDKYVLDKLDILDLDKLHIIEIFQQLIAIFLQDNFRNQKQKSVDEEKNMTTNHIPTTHWPQFTYIIGPLLKPKSKHNKSYI